MVEGKALIEDIKYLLNKGYSVQKIAHELGCSDRTITRRMEQYGIEKPPKKEPPVVDEILELHKQGLSCEEIARKIYMSYSYVYKTIKRKEAKNEDQKRDN